MAQQWKRFSSDFLGASLWSTQEGSIRVPGFLKIINLLCAPLSKWTSSLKKTISQSCFCGHWFQIAWDQSTLLKQMSVGRKDAWQAVHLNSLRPLRASWIVFQCTWLSPTKLNSFSISQYEIAWSSANCASSIQSSIAFAVSSDIACFQPQGSSWFESLWRVRARLLLRILRPAASETSKVSKTSWILYGIALSLQNFLTAKMLARFGVS